MAIVSRAARVAYDLVLGGKCYTFAPRGDVVQIAYRGPWPWRDYTVEVPLAEARAHWMRLVAKGFERW